VLPNTLVTLRIEKPAAGGRMIARHEGMVVLVAGAIPGEVVSARVERVERSMAYASVDTVIDAHPGRREVHGDPRCGGATYAHIDPAVQRTLKGEVIADTLRRLARVPWETPIDVAASPERGYRMRARLHLREGRLGFFLEGTHDVCDTDASGQLLETTVPAVTRALEALQPAGYGGQADIDVSENVAADHRAIHLELESGYIRPSSPNVLVDGMTGVSWSAPGSDEQVVSGQPSVVDVLSVPGPGGEPVAVRFRRHVRAFFQGNRYLLADMVAGVVGSCGPGSAVDLYAGVGLFGVSLAATGNHEVVAVEGHAASARDLRANAAPYADHIVVHEASVERYLARSAGQCPMTVVLDPPRTGMTKDAAAGVVALSPQRIVFVSCDVATFARDVKRFIEAGYQLETIRAFDLFPNTAHVEVLARLTRGRV
jgi:tRNA/tmRNA/rRNA uracil-C5-methylase (TrmA/RlmC/RlmD family)